MRSRAARRARWVVGTAVVLIAVAACGDDGTQPPDAPAAAPTSTPAATLEYAPGLTEDLYLPERDGGPLVVIVPGGSWETADPTGLAPLAAALADAGIAAAPTHIRAAQDGVVSPVPVEDILCALSVADQEARAAGFDPDRLVLLGHSSGAHLASLAVLAVDDYSPACRAPLVRPDALVGLSGPYDISRIPEYAEAFLGSTPDEDPEAWASANPVTRAGLRPDVPVLLLHGADDDVVPTAFAEQFAAALEEHGHPTTTQVVPDVDHLEIFGADVATEPIASWLSGLE